MKRCPRGHLGSDTVCSRCGHLFPLSAEARVGPLRFPLLLRSYGHANLYLIRQQGEVLSLWEGLAGQAPPNQAEHLRAWLDSPESARPGWARLQRAFVVEDRLYLLQAGKADGFLDGRLQQLVEPELLKRWFHQLLSAWAFFRERQLIYHGFASPLLQLAGDRLQLNLAPWGDGQGHSLRGFVPPAGSSIPLDRYGLAMILFQGLTGLSPALWSPDTPRLRPYQYLWGKAAVGFFDELLGGDSPPEELMRQWQGLELRLQPNEAPRLRQELGAFHRALELLSQGQSAAAREGLLALQTPLLHNPHVLSLLGELQPHAADALEAYRESLRREQLGSTWLKLGGFYLARGVRDRAQRAFSKALERLPESAEPRWRLGALAVERAQYTQAARWLKQAQRIEPTPIAAQWLRRLELELAAGSGQREHETGFSFAFDRWDQTFSERQLRHLCPAGHAQAREGSHCQTCRRPMHWLAGETLADYLIEAVVAVRDLAGKHRSSAYRARLGEQAVLIKEITPDAAGQERYAREVKALERLKGPGLPQLLARFARDEKLYLVQTLQTGEDLETLVQNHGPLPEGEVRSLLQQGLALLQILADASWVHGDLKPKNLLWDGSRLSLIDFDVSVELTHPRCLSPGATRHYAAPGQRRNGLVDARSDAYSLGLTLLWTLTGLSPELFRYTTAAGVRYLHWQGYAHSSSGLEHWLQDLLNSRHQPDLARLKASALQLGLPTRQNPLSGLIREYYALHRAPDQVCLPGLRTLLAQRPDARLHYLVGHELLARGSQGQAAEHLHTAIVMDPDWPYPYWELAGILRRQQQPLQARELLERALTTTGPQPETLRQLAELEYEAGHYRQALQRLAQGLRQTPDDEGLLLAEARTLFRMQTLATAHERCERILALNPSSAPAYRLLQRIAAARLLPEEALRCGRRAISLAPDDPAAYFELGQSCYRFQRFELAVALLEAARALEPRLWEACYFLGASLLMLGEFTEAEKQLRLALRSGKEPELIQARLADLEQLRALKALDRSAG